MKKTLDIPFSDVPFSFSGAARAEINDYCWGGEYRPIANGYIYYSSDAFYIKLEAEEKPQNIRTEERGITENACLDSCLEFFIMPYPEKDKRYFNFEFTPAGALYLGLGKDRYDNVLLTDTDLSQFNITTDMKTENGVTKWSVTAKIPFDFINKAMGTYISFVKPHEINLNFYKCGDMCPEIHYGVWNKVLSKEPDFHLSEYFGKAYLK